MRFPDLVPPETFPSPASWLPDLKQLQDTPEDTALNSDSTTQLDQGSRSSAMRRLQNVVEQDHTDYVLEPYLKPTAAPLGLEAVPVEPIEPSPMEQSLRSSEEPSVANIATNVLIDFFTGIGTDGGQVRAAEVNLDANKFLTKQELLRMARSSGVHIDLNTLRTWEKSGLLAATVAERSEGYFRRQKYYSLDALFRLQFIQRCLERLHLSLDVIRFELEKLDREYAGHPSSQDYLARLEKLDTLRMPSFDPGLLYLLAQHLGITVDEIEEIVIYRKNKSQIQIKGMTELSPRVNVEST